MDDVRRERDELLYGPGKRLNSFHGELWEAEVKAQLHNPGNPFCIVQGWRIIEVNVDEDYRQSLEKAGLLPFVLYASYVIKHSTDATKTNDWVRSTFQKKIDAGEHVFETKNSVYVLKGWGLQLKGSGRAVIAISQGTGHLV